MNLAAGISAHQDDPLSELRTVSRRIHEDVDQAFGRFDLGERNSYGRFLQAHARVLPAVEHVLLRYDTLPSWSPRGPLLLADLEQLGLSVPDSLPVQLPQGDAAALGALYVLEGSRLGGRVLSRQVEAGLPHAYLSAGHEKGSWPAFLGELQARLKAESPQGRQSAMEGVVKTFELFRESAAGDQT
ncbi:biliverdin-producing heme oxygenase [Gluconobacter morbifer]|uniref:Heme oxygenase n=1 Tax=Gluconobacter morbifer G707 TaxID=1088869 RepID=G6XKQ2_9PROT|nr:biliverdin-producing heme oxygenase [Gluconobacter morbifer]EHH67615.1 hypothetical protein GMO_20680 [Gluconobacter morbifer G707]